MKWQASREESKRTGFISIVSFFAGLATLGVAIFVLWMGRHHSTDLVDHLLDPRGFLPGVPPNPPSPPPVDHSLMWQALIITSGTVLLLVTVATLLFKVADRYAHLSREHAGEADATRRMEAAIRIAMAYGVPKYADKNSAAFKIAEAFNAVALKLLEPAPERKLVPAELAALPDTIKELAQVIGDTRRALAKEGKGEG